MKKKSQIDLEDCIADANGNPARPSNILYSACYPWRHDVPYVDPLPSLTRQEFTDECDINQIMKNFEETGVLPVNDRTPLYWDADAVPVDLQAALNQVAYADELFMQLPATVRKEFENNAVKFVHYCSNPENTKQLKEWGLLSPEVVPPAPMRVEVVSKAPDPNKPMGEPPKEPPPPGK